MDLFLKISLDFEAQFEYNICHERIFKATMVDTRESTVERALLWNDCRWTTGKSIASSHRKLNTQTSSVPT